MAKILKKPGWLKIDLKDLNKNNKEVRELLRQNKLHTVCEEANCPNKLECFSSKTATFMILGKKCTRNCKFCDVSNGAPTFVDKGEPKRLVEAVKKLGLKHVVITSVTRDDLMDGGAIQFASCIKEIKKQFSDVTVEVLIPDLQGNLDNLMKIIKAKPDIINHNVETVPRLYETVRDNADYKRSLKIIKAVKEFDNNILTKSGLMVGLGETNEEIKSVMNDLRNINCDIITIGQYLMPSRSHIEVVEYIHPDTFKEYENYGYEIGFKQVASGPLVRSSYKASMPIERGERIERN